MTTLDCLERSISDLEYGVSHVKVWYDGTITFRIGKFLLGATLNDIDSEIYLGLDINSDNFDRHDALIDDELLTFLANEMSTNIDAVSFHALLYGEGECLCLRKTIQYVRLDEISRQIARSISSLLIHADAAIAILSNEFIYEYTDPHDLYRLMTDAVHDSTYRFVVDHLPQVRILVVDDLSTPGLGGFKTSLKNLLPQCTIVDVPAPATKQETGAAIQSALRDRDIDIVVAAGSAAPLALQLKNTPRILLCPVFDRKPQAKPDESTIGFFNPDETSGADAMTYINLFGPIHVLDSGYNEIGDATIRTAIIPAIAGLYFKKRHSEPVFRV